MIDSHAEAKVQGPGVATGRSGSIGKVHFIPGDYWPLNTALYVKDFHGNEPRFVFRLLQHLDLSTYASGAGVPTLNRNNVHPAIVVVPESIREQERIVAILDEAFDAIDTAIANTEKNLVNARELFESYLNSVFDQQSVGWVENRLAIDRKEWPFAEVQEICESIVDCVNKTAPKVAYETPYLMIRTSNIRNGVVDLTKVKYVDEETYKIWTRRQVPRVGDVLLTREAPMGEAGMLVTDDTVFLGQRVVSYRTDPTKLLPEFLLFAFRSQFIQKQISSKGSGASVEHMRVPDSKTLRLPVPNLHVQELIAKELHGCADQTEQMKFSFESKLSKLQDLKQSILQKAFAGELTASADQMLEEAGL